MLICELLYHLNLAHGFPSRPLKFSIQEPIGLLRDLPKFQILQCSNYHCNKQDQVYVLLSFLYNFRRKGVTVLMMLLVMNLCIPHDWQPPKEQTPPAATTVTKRTSGPAPRRTGGVRKGAEIGHGRGSTSPLKRKRKMRKILHIQSKTNIIGRMIKKTLLCLLLRALKHPNQEG